MPNRLTSNPIIPVATLVATKDKAALRPGLWGQTAARAATVTTMSTIIMDWISVMVIF